VLLAGKQPQLALPLARAAASLNARYQSSAALEPEFQKRLGEHFISTAVELTELKEWDAALEQAELARRALEDYARAVPGAVDAEQALADLWHRLGKAQWGAGRHETAVSALRQSNRLEKQLFANKPSQESHLRLSKSLDRLYYFASQAGDLHTAAESLADREKLWLDHPEKLREVADDYQSLADQLAARKSLSAAEQSDRQHYLAESRRTHDAASAAGRGEAYKKQTPTQL
jgi:hypothetical protein